MLHSMVNVFVSKHVVPCMDQSSDEANVFMCVYVLHIFSTQYNII